jgi:hypothetical protein
MNTNLLHGKALAAVPDGANAIRFYDKAIPDFAAAAMDACYGALTSSVAYLRLAGRLGPSTSTYVAFDAGAVRSVFLVEREGTVLKVLNGAIRTEQEELARFADYMFAHWPDIDRICFPGVHMPSLRVPYPCQRVLAGEDIVIAFAGAPEAYTQSLGRNTRKSIKRHATALAKRHPTARYEVVAGEAVDARLTGLIADWNRRRMSGKDKVSAYREDEIGRITALAARAGMVGTVRIDGRVRAGTVCCRVGDTCYLAVMGYDSDYDAFSLGLLCNYWTTLECLRARCGEINLMGGRLPYKYSLLGESRKYDAVVLYRSRAALLRNAGDAARTALRGCATAAKFAILDCERREDRAARLVTGAIAAWRRSRRGYRQVRKRIFLSIDCMWMAVAVEVAGSVPLP